MSNMSLSAYVFGFVDPNASPSPQPPQPGISDALPPAGGSIASDTTSLTLLDYLERNVDTIESENF